MAVLPVMLTDAVSDKLSPKQFYVVLGDLYTDYS